jgi:S-adenosylmethionine hydrolase
MTMINRPLVTMTTDFGYMDAYVASMKGVMLGINKEIEIVDICHEIRPQDVFHGAFVISTGYSFFPEGTIHLGVVDPGVGGIRRAILIQTNRYLFIGPDNGLFSYILKKEPVLSIRTLENKAHFRNDVSSTFHGRDIFAPVAGHLTRGIPIEEMGSEITNPTILEIPEPIIKEDMLVAHVLCIDRFGNLITNVTRSFWNQLVGNRRFFIYCRMRIEKINKSYNESQPNDILAIFNSSGFLEISSNLGNAAKELGLKPGSEIEIELR